MVISYQGGESVRVSFGDITLAFNPISKDSKLKGSRFGADIALISLNHPDMNGIGQAGHGEKEPFVISGPGEYEIRGIAIHGFPATSTYGGAERTNTIYYVTLEGMHLLFLGALSEAKLPQEVIKAVDEVDILFVPIGGDGVLLPASAHELSVKLEAKMIIPMHFETSAGAVGSKDALKTFLKEAGVESAQPLEKLTIKQRDLTGLSGSVTVLSP